MVHFLFVIIELFSLSYGLRSPPLDSVRVMVIVWKLRELLCAGLCDTMLTVNSTLSLYEQFLQVKQIGFVTLGPLRCAAVAVA